jgi:hypothetical protein
MLAPKLAICEWRMTPGALDIKAGVRLQVQEEVLSTWVSLFKM